MRILYASLFYSIKGFLEQVHLVMAYRLWEGPFYVKIWAICKKHANGHNTYTIHIKSTWCFSWNGLSLQLGNYAIHVIVVWRNPKLEDWTRVTLNWDKTSRMGSLAFTFKNTRIGSQ